ncbi:MAG: magnesium/cobalt transporter CorA [Fimbriiglobus sp.]
MTQWTPGSPERTEITAADLPATIADVPEGTVIWVDLDSPTAEEEAWAFQRFFPIHPLTLEDVRKPRERPDEGAHLPKAEEFQDYLFVVVNPLPPWAGKPTGKPASPADSFPDDPVTRPKLSKHGRPQLSAILTEKVLFTHRYEPLGCLADVHTYVDRHKDCGHRGPDFLFHLILDVMVDEYAPVVERIADQLDRLEAKLFTRPTADLLHRLLKLKRRVTFLRKTLILEREVLFRLQRGEFALVDAREMAYYRNVYDHLVRYTDLIENAREMVSDLMETHLSATSHRLNEVMKLLTMTSTVLLPMTLVAGVYGMNFEHMPELKWVNGYYFAIALMAAIAAGAVGFFRWKRWL